MNIEFQISTDEDGFIWRQCPICDEKFKWHDGPIAGSEGSEPAEVYFCPFCGGSADPSSWFTREQIEAAENAALAPLQQMFSDEVSKIGKPKRGSLISIDWDVELPHAGTTQLEGHDDNFEIVASPCHPHEPVKVPVEEGVAFHCLICGKRYIV